LGEFFVKLVAIFAKPFKFRFKETVNFIKEPFGDEANGFEKTTMMSS